jgi:hypothetical protein
MLRRVVEDIAELAAIVVFLSMVVIWSGIAATGL